MLDASIVPILEAMLSNRSAFKQAVLVGLDQEDDILHFALETVKSQTPVKLSFLDAVQDLSLEEDLESQSGGYTI